MTSLVDDPTLTLRERSLNLKLDEAAEQISSQQQLSNQALKLKMANHARLMQDNQRTLDRTANADKALRDERRRFREGQLAKAGAPPASSLPTPPADESTMGDINIDSPTDQSVHHYHPQQPPAPKTGMGKTAAVLLALAAGGLVAGAMFGIPLLIDAVKDKPATVQPTPPAPVTAEQEFEAVYRQLQPDGTWKIIKREPLPKP